MTDLVTRRFCFDQAVAVEVAAAVAADDDEAS